MDQVDELAQRLRPTALLDKLYVSIRDPNGLPDLTPGQVFTREDAAPALHAAKCLLASSRAGVQEG
jgi:hypothetical protein